MPSQFVIISEYSILYKFYSFILLSLLSLQNVSSVKELDGQYLPIIIKVKYIIIIIIIITNNHDY